MFEWDCGMWEGFWKEMDTKKNDLYICLLIHFHNSVLFAAQSNLQENYTLFFPSTQRAQQSR